MKVLTILSNKKADMSARKLIFYCVVGFVLVAMFFLIIWLVYSNKSDISEIPIGLENYLMVQRFLNSPSCFAFQDKDSNRVYQWTIDFKKFNQDMLNKCYNEETTSVKAYRLTLNYGNKKITINTRNWEGFLKKAETKNVIIYDEGKIQRAELFIETQDAK